jgi:5-methyltetrahydropteroyltriglutamate--homocysteine methyltransferase
LSEQTRQSWRLARPWFLDDCPGYQAQRAEENTVTYPTRLLPTTVVGSYPQPSWLVDGEALKQHGVPRVHAHGIWRVDDASLEQAQDDGTILAIGAMERAGIDIVTDGEIRRESYSNRFALALEGVDADHPGEVRSQTGRATPVPRVVGKIRWRGPVELPDTEFLLRHATHATKITLPGPFTMTQQARNDFYEDEEELAMDYAIAVNEELRALKATGVDVLQLDEPWVRTSPDKAKRFGIRAINRALEGIEGPTVVHICFGYAAVVSSKPSGYSFLPQLADTIATQISIEAAQPKLDLGVLRDLTDKRIMLGVIDLGDPGIETAEIVADRIRAGLRFVAPENLIPAPDCGMKYLSRAVAFGKLKALADGAAIVRRELSGST